MKEEKLKIGDILKLSSCGSVLLLIFEFLAVILFPFLYGLAAKNTDYTNILYSKNFKFALSYICLYLILIPLLLLFYHFIRGKKIDHRLKTYFRKPERSFAWCAKWTVIGIGVFQFFGFCLTYLITLLRSYFNLPSSIDVPQIKCNAFGYIALFIVTCIFAPFLEELLFRGTLFTNNKPMGEGFAIVVTGLFFALWHTNYTQFVFAFGLGMVASLMVLKTKSLFPSMICHFVNNLISYIMEIGSLQFYSVTGTSADMISIFRFLYTYNIMLFVIYGACWLLVAIFVILGFILLIREFIKLKKRNSLEKGTFETSSIKAKILYFISPITLVTVIWLVYDTFFV